MSLGEAFFQGFLYTIIIAATLSMIIVIIMKVPESASYIQIKQEEIQDAIKSEMTIQNVEIFQTPAPGTILITVKNTGKKSFILVNNTEVYIDGLRIPNTNKTITINEQRNTEMWDPEETADIVVIKGLIGDTHQIKVINSYTASATLFGDGLIPITPPEEPPVQYCPASMSGEGSILLPCLITTCAQLQAIEQNLTLNYELNNNIDCSNSEDWNSGLGFDPIGNETVSFSGILNGADKTISSLTINRSTESKIGLFNDIPINAIVKNVELTNANVTGNVYVGILAGRVMGKVNKTSIEGTVLGTDYTGGMTGINYGNITQSDATTAVAGVGSVGGLVGWNDARITNCYTNTTISGEYDVGGLVGSNDLGTILNTYSLGSITCSDSCGGLTGYNYQGTIQNSYTSSEISGDSTTGGLSGGNDATITNSYWNNIATNPDECYSGGDVGCTVITNNEAYFYNYLNSPINSWNFISIWSSTNNNSNHATLQ